MKKFTLLKMVVVGLTTLTIGVAEMRGSIAVLSWEDLDVGTSVVPGAVADLGAGYSLTTASSQANFNSLLGSGTWDIVIFGEQNTSVYGGSAPALTAYVSGGGKLIGVTWIPASGLLGLMQATSVPSINSTTIITDGDPIFNSPFAMGASIPLNNPGWGVFSLSYDTGAQGVGTLDAGYAVVRGNGGRTLLDSPLFDSYGSLAQGQQFLANEIYSLTAVPEPTTMRIAGALLLLPLGASTLRKFRKSRTA